MSVQSDPDQCALDENGQLKDAKDITWLNSPSDKDPIPLPPVEADDGGTPRRLDMLSILQLLMPSIAAPHCRPRRNKNSGLQDILAAERLDEWGGLEKKHRPPKGRPKRNTKRVKVVESLSDHEPDDDDEYQTEVVDSISEASNTSEGDIQNEEVGVGSVVLSAVLMLVSASRRSSFEDGASWYEARPGSKAKAF